MPINNKSISFNISITSFNPNCSCVFEEKI